VRNIACNRFSLYARADLGHDAPQGMSDGRADVGHPAGHLASAELFCNPLALVPLVPGQAPAVLAAPWRGPLTPSLGATMNDLKHRLAAILASPKGKALIEAGQKFSMEELQAACAEVLAEAESSDERAVIEAALKALIARKAN
jgi:hypothetical protein